MGVNLAKKHFNDYFMIYGLILLSLIPAIAGIARTIQIINNQTAADNLRFISNPTPALVHIISSAIFSILGAFQFSKKFRINYPQWHKNSGRLLLAMAFLVSISGLWMTYVYPPVNHDGKIVYIFRLIVGYSILFFLFQSIRALLRKNFLNHGIWMTRAYALSLGAGTQVFTHIPIFIFPTIQGEISRAIAMGMGWIINIAIAELIISKQRNKRMSHE